METPIAPFRIQILDSAVEDLRDRLRATRLPDPLPGDGWSGGVPMATLRELVERWVEHDWRATETRLNTLPQISARIEEQTIHAVHVRSGVENATPLLLLHGWPGSFLEFEQLIGPLTDPLAHGGSTEDAFDVVIPSLPGFGFSTPLETPGWTDARSAGVLLKLMTALGHDRFAVQGGDVGAGIAPEIGRHSPERVIGIHLNGAPEFPGELDEETLAGLTELEQERVRRIGTFMTEEFGYIALQSTRPGLIGAMTADSPVAQLAWMYDKLQAWTHPPERSAIDVLGEEFVLANASLYWFTRSAGSAAYVGYAQEQAWGAVPENSGVPTAALQLAHDIGVRAVAEPSHTIVRWTDVPDRGGHFAALEEPTLLVENLRAFLRELR